MRRFFPGLLSISLVLLTAVAWAQPAIDKEQEDSLLSFLVGSYDIIGRLPESRQLYSGEMDISRAGDKLVLKRSVRGVTTRCEATVQPATADNLPVIRTAWKQGNANYGATYLIHTDLDNYPRLTAYVYYSGKDTKTPGLEALFFKKSR